MIQVYEANTTDFTKNGRPLIPEDAYTESELNGAWTATLVHPIDAEGRWKYLTEQAIVKMPSWNGEQLYRITSRTKDEVSVTCTMYPIFFDSMSDCFLVDTKVTNEGGTAALTAMLQNSSKYSASSNITEKKTAYYEYVNFMEALNGESDNSFIRVWGGEIEYDNLAVKVNARMGADNGLSMRYGLNIQHITEEVDLSGVMTRIYPSAYNDRRASSYVDSSLISSYPTPKIGTMTFNNIKTSGDATEEDESDPAITICHNQAELDAALTAAVNAEYTAGLDKPVVNITVDGVFDLSKIKGFEAWERVSIGLGDTVHLTHSRLDIMTDARIIYIRYDSIRDQVADIQIGSKPYSFFNAVSDLQAQVEAGALDGKDGKDGDAGASVRAVWFEWSQASANVIPSGGTYEDIRITAWSETQQTYVSGRFYWMRSVTELTDGTIIYGDPIFDMASQVAAEAKAAAATAQSTANTAEGIANSAAQTANQKRRVFLATPTTPYDRGDLYFDGPHGLTYICTTSRASGAYRSTDWTEYSEDVSAHFWYDSSGAHVSDTQGDVTTGNSQTIAPAGTVMMRNGKLVSSWTEDSNGKAAINFYDGTAATAAASHLLASYGANGVTQYVAGLVAMALTASGMSVYGIDTVNNRSITEAIFGLTGIELYADGTKMIELTKTNGLVFYDTDGSTVVGKFKGSEIELHAKSSTRKNDIYLGSSGLRLRTATLSSGSETGSNELRINDGTFSFLQDGTQYGSIQKMILNNDPMLQLLSVAGLSLLTDSSNYMRVYPAGMNTAAGFWLGGANFRWNGYGVLDSIGRALKAVADQNGNSIMARDVTITSLSSSLDTGLYRYSSSATGVPTSAGGTLLNLHRSDNYAAQLAFPNSSSGYRNIYFRTAYPSGDSVVWTAWTRVVTEASAKWDDYLPQGSSITSMWQDHATGLYKYTSSCTGAPSSRGGWVLVLRYSADLSHRIAWPNGGSAKTPTMYVSVEYEGTFSNWKQIY